MNTKTISYINKKTGEVADITINDLATKLGINRSTINRRLKPGKYEDDNCIISNVAPQTQMLHPNVANEPPNVALEPNVAPTIQTFIQNYDPISGKSKTTPDNKHLLRQLQQNDLNQLKTKPQITPGKTIPNEPCALCGKKTFHTKRFNPGDETENPFHICFATCKKPPKATPKQPSKEQIEYLQQYIRDNSKLKSITKASEL